MVLFKLQADHETTKAHQVCLPLVCRFYEADQDAITTSSASPADATRLPGSRPNGLWNGTEYYYI